MLMVIGAEAAAVEVPAVEEESDVAGVSAGAGSVPAAVGATAGAGLVAGFSLADRVLDCAAAEAMGATFVVAACAVAACVVAACAVEVESMFATDAAAFCACAGANESGKNVSAASKMRDEERGRQLWGKRWFKGCVICVKEAKGVAGCVVG